ncbi:hypothetical protein [Streptomyces sp. NPDC049744]|uniref:hypothetical protein n=1 Tax=Streptomyces sp. NPDC049744 TaxID=3154359 RepID=UPI0034193FEB
MAPKRGDAAAPPPVGDEYGVRFATNDAAKGWEDFCRQEPNNTRWAYEQMRDNPGCCKEGPTTRHSRLRAEFSVATHGGVELPQWQLEVTSGGRVWYLVDEARRLVWIRKAGRGHPKATE